MYINKEINYLEYLKKKNKEIFIFGCGRNGKRTLKRLENNDIKVRGFIDNSSDLWGTMVEGRRVISLQEYKKIMKENSLIIICGYESEIKQQLMQDDMFGFIAESQIDFGGSSEWYDKEYYEWYREIGEFGGKVKAKLFEPYIKEDMTVVDFGSGGGHILANVNAKHKVGVEINPYARKMALENGIKSVESLDVLDDDCVDIVISSSTLNHVEQPLEILRQVYKILKKDGLAVFHVRNASCDEEYVRSEINNQLYSWNCQLLGNLFKTAGFFVYSVENIHEVWPKYYKEIYDQTGEYLFDQLCYFGGKILNKNNCLIVAKK